MAHYRKKKKQIYCRKKKCCFWTSLNNCFVSSAVVFICGYLQSKLIRDMWMNEIKF